MQVGEFVTWVERPWGLRRASRTRRGVIVEIGRRKIQVETTDSFGDLVRYWVKPDQLQLASPLDDKPLLRGRLT